jgi:hypothetical protein
VSGLIRKNPRARPFSFSKKLNLLQNFIETNLAMKRLKQAEDDPRNRDCDSHGVAR